MFCAACSPLKWESGHITHSLLQAPHIHPTPSTFPSHVKKYIKSAGEEAEEEEEREEVEVGPGKRKMDRGGGGGREIKREA